MWRKIYVVFQIVLMTILLSACGMHNHQYMDATCEKPAICSECKETMGDALGHTSTVGICSRCGKTGNEELISALNTDFEQMIETGTHLFSCLAGIADLDANTQHERYLEANKYTDTMMCIYDKIITICENAEELKPIVYQTNLLKNTCPPPISGSDATALANQGILYQLHLQQLSSSCSYMSEIMGYLSGNGNQPAGIQYFEEVPDMATPDSIIYGISYKSTENAPGNIQYMYLIGDDETDAMLNYNLFISAIELGTGLKVDISDSMAMVFHNGNMVSVMMAGYDSSIGYFLTVSFQG